MKVLGLVCIAFLSLPTKAQDGVIEPPSARVTFYTSGGRWLNGLPGYKGGLFIGPIFDGDRRLAYIDGRHFLTIEFDPGKHVFAANGWPRSQPPKGDPHLVLDLAPGQHSFIRIWKDTSKLGLPITRMEETACQVAQKDNLGAKQLNIKGIPHAVNEHAFPRCP